MMFHWDNSIHVGGNCRHAMEVFCPPAKVKEPIEMYGRRLTTAHEEVGFFTLESQSSYAESSTLYDKGWKHVLRGVAKKSHT